MRGVFSRSRSLQANRCSHLVSSSLACFAHPWANLLDPGDLIHPGYSLSWSTGRSSWGSHWEGYWWHLTGWSDFNDDDLGQDHNGVSTQVPQADQHSGGPRCNFPHAAAGTMEAGSLGPHASSASTWTCMQCPQMSVWPWIFIVPNGGMVTLCVVQTCPWMSSGWNSLGTVGLRVDEGVPPLWGLCSPCAFKGQLEWPRHGCTEVGLPPGCSCLG